MSYAGASSLAKPPFDEIISSDDLGRISVISVNHSVAAADLVAIILVPEGNGHHQYLTNCMSPGPLKALAYCKSGFSQIPYRIFILPPTSTKSTAAPTTFDSELRRAQITLLRRGQLVNVSNGELWTFSRDGAQFAPIPDENTGLQGTIIMFSD